MHHPTQMRRKLITALGAGAFASTLGLTIPQALLITAEKVIE